MQIKFQDPSFSLIKVAEGKATFCGPTGVPVSFPVRQLMAIEKNEVFEEFRKEADAAGVQVWTYTVQYPGPTCEPKWVVFFEDGSSVTLRGSEIELRRWASAGTAVGTSSRGGVRCLSECGSLGMTPGIAERILSRLRSQLS